MNNALKRWIDLVSVQDMQGVVNLYTNDALLLGTFSNEIRIGKDEIEKYFEFFLAKNPKALVVNSKMHILNEDNFTVNGFYDFEVDSAQGDRNLAHARFTFVFQRQDGEFKILSHHSSVMP